MLSIHPINRPKIQELVRIFNINVSPNLIQNELPKKKEIFENNKILGNYKIGDKCVIDKHNHLLTLADDNIRGYKNGWRCNICKKNFNINLLSWFCKNCQFDACFDCFKKYKKNNFVNEVDEIKKNFCLGDKVKISKHSHILVVSNNDKRKYRNFWKCDICKKTFKKNTFSFFCKKCKYDSCYNCYKKYKVDIDSDEENSSERSSNKESYYEENNSDYDEESSSEKNSDDESDFEDNNSDYDEENSSEKSSNNESYYEENYSDYY